MGGIHARHRRIGRGSLSPHLSDATATSGLEGGMGGRSIGGILAIMKRYLQKIATDTCETVRNLFTFPFLRTVCYAMY